MITVLPNRCILKKSVVFGLKLLCIEQNAVLQRLIPDIFLLPIYRSWRFVRQIFALRNLLPILPRVLLIHPQRVVYLLIQENLTVLPKRKTHPYRYELFFDAFDLFPVQAISIGNNRFFSFTRREKEMQRMFFKMFPNRFL